MYSCKKEGTNKEFTLKGQLLDNCTGLPSGNVTLDLWQNLIEGTTIFDPDKPAYLIMSTTTDANGNFEFKKEFDTKNSVNFPRNGSLRIASGASFLSTGWFEIESGKFELDLGALYKDIDKTLPFVILNSVNFEVGDKIILSKPNDLFSFDTIPVTSTTNQFVINRQSHYSTKNIAYGTAINQCSYLAQTIVSWDLINNPDHSGQFSVSTLNCTSLDSVYIKWW